MENNQETPKCENCNNPQDKCNCTTGLYGELIPGHEIKTPKMEICDSCPHLDELSDFTDISGKTLRLCKTCIKRERKLFDEKMQKALEYQAPEKQEERLANHNMVQDLIKQAKSMDESIGLSTDLFNAKTTAIIDLKAEIDADTSLTPEQKNFKLAEVLMGRFQKFTSVIFEARKTMGDAFAEQKAIQVYMNNLANSLRAEEREKLKIADITYTVKLPKPVSPKAIKLTQKKASRDDIKKAAGELGIDERTLTLVMTSKNWDLETTLNHFRKTIAEAKSMIK